MSEKPSVNLAKIEAGDFYRYIMFIGVTETIVLFAVMGGMIWVGVNPIWIVCTIIIVAFFFLMHIVATVATRLDVGRSWAEQALEHVIDNQYDPPLTYR